MNRGRARRLLLKVGPYLLTAVVVFAILRRYPVDEILHALGAGRASRLLPIAFGFALLQIVLASTWDWIVLDSVLGGPRWIDVVRVKSGCAVLQSIGYLLNAGAYGTWIARATKSGATVAGALVVYAAMSDLASGALFASIATSIAGADVGAVLRFGAPVLFVVVLGLLVGPARASLEPSATPTHGARAVFRAVPRRRAVLQLVCRLSSALLVVSAIWAGANAFGLPLPFRAAMTYVPVIILVGSLPVNVLGFGPVQGVWLLFATWAPGAQVLAFQIAWNVAILIAYLVRGALFVPRILREVAEGRREPDDVPLLSADSEPGDPLAR